MRKLGFLKFLPALIAVILPLETLAFFSFIPKVKIDTPSLHFTAFVGSEYSAWKNIIEIGEKQTLSTSSGNFLIANHPPNYFKKTVSRKAILAVATAYSSTIDQTDNTPFITASGIHVRDGVVAANFLPFGTVIKIPELFGDKTFVVEDRMNGRYGHGRIDIWFPEINLAKEFGVKKIKIEIIS